MFFVPRFSLTEKCNELPDTLAGAKFNSYRVYTEDGKMEEAFRGRIRN